MRCMHKEGMETRSAFKSDLAKTNELSLLSALNLAVSSTERFLYLWMHSALSPPPLHYRRETSISASTKSFGIWISSVHRPLIWIYWNEENILSALSEGGLLLLQSGSMCSASSDHHHFAGLALFETLEVQIHRLDSVQIRCKKCRHCIRCQLYTYLKHI